MGLISPHLPLCSFQIAVCRIRHFGMFVEPLRTASATRLHGHRIRVRLSASHLHITLVHVLILDALEPIPNTLCPSICSPPNSVRQISTPRTVLTSTQHVSLPAPNVHPSPPSTSQQPQIARNQSHETFSPRGNPTTRYPHTLSSLSYPSYRCLRELGH